MISTCCTPSRLAAATCSCNSVHSEWASRIFWLTWASCSRRLVASISATDLALVAAAASALAVLAASLHFLISLSAASAAAWAFFNSSVAFLAAAADFEASLAAAASEALSRASSVFNSPTSAATASSAASFLFAASALSSFPLTCSNSTRLDEARSLSSCFTLASAFSREPWTDLRSLSAPRSSPSLASSCASAFLRISSCSSRFARELRRSADSDLSLVTSCCNLSAVDRAVLASFSSFGSTWTCLALSWASCILR
mmetsp:Transcript_7776/g.18034  ORF Transcript_7776/g.18034 Transcript_7776/m.18034 type:complete len:258 (+) Transcript_7776:1241-2014(+)